MAALTISGLRRTLAAVLIFALTLSGVGRAVASTANPVEPITAIAGVAVPICHSGGGVPSDPAVPVQHDCCDACALMAPVLLPAPVLLAAPATIEHVADHARAIAWAPVVVRLRSPRQSRGPPAA